MLTNKIQSNFDKGRRQCSQQGAHGRPGILGDPPGDGQNFREQLFSLIRELVSIFANSRSKLKYFKVILIKAVKD